VDVRFPPVSTDYESRHYSDGLDPARLALEPGEEISDASFFLLEQLSI
jgi:hypothetical protein